MSVGADEGVLMARLGVLTTLASYRLSVPAAWQREVADAVLAVVAAGGAVEQVAATLDAQRVGQARHPAVLAASRALVAALRGEQ